MISSTHSPKLAQLLQLCFAAGLVFSSASAFADACNLTPGQVCTQPGPGHNLPSICEQYPNDVQCLGGWGSGNGTTAAASITEIFPWTTAIPRGPGNGVAASCASDYGVRLQSALNDVSAWWPSFGGNWTSPTVDGKETITVTYSSGEREIWQFSHGASAGNPGNPVYGNPLFGNGVLTSVGMDGPYGEYGGYEVASGGVYGGGPRVGELCK